jgi:co-chaperonin GroES (HSP10)
MRLKNFNPTKNQVLAKIKLYTTTPGGLLLQEPEHDLFAEVVAVGPTVESIKVGQLVMFGGTPGLQMPFEDEKGKGVHCILTNEFNVLATYTPDKDESRFFVPGNHVRQSEPNTAPTKVIGSDQLGEWGQANQDLLR